MSEYNDGLTGALGEYFIKLGKVGDIVIESIKEQIDIETEAVEKSIIDNTPKKTGGLKESLRKTKIDNRNNRYGYCWNTKVIRPTAHLMQKSQTY